MATHADVKRIARSLPGAVEERGGLAFSVAKTPSAKPKGFTWVWLERIHPKKARVPNPTVFVVRVADESEKAFLLAADPDVFFTEPHYNGYAAVLVRLANIDAKRLRQVLTAAHALMAPVATSAKPKRSPARARSSPRGRGRA